MYQHLTDQERFVLFVFAMCGHSAEGEDQVLLPLWEAAYRMGDHAGASSLHDFRTDFMELATRFNLGHVCTPAARPDDVSLLAATFANTTGTNNAPAEAFHGFCTTHRDTILNIGCNINTDTRELIPAGYLPSEPALQRFLEQLQD